MKDEVRRLREAAGLTQNELASRSGVAQPNIAAYESGRRIPSADMLARLRVATRPIPHEALQHHRSELTDLAQTYGLTKLRVFGSAMRGKDTPGSDLDLLVTRPKGVGLLTLAAFAEDAENLLGVEVDVVSDGGLDSNHEIVQTAVDL